MCIATLNPSEQPLSLFPWQFCSLYFCLTQNHSWHIVLLERFFIFDTFHNESFHNFLMMIENFWGYNSFLWDFIDFLRWILLIKLIIYWTSYQKRPPKSTSMLIDLHPFALAKFWSCFIMISARYDNFQQFLYPTNNFTAIVVLLWNECHFMTASGL